MRRSPDASSLASASPVDLLPPLPAGMRGLNVRDFLEEAVAGDPGAPALITYEEEITYAELDGRVDRAAAAWQELGVGKGDRVAFMLENSADFVVSWLGLAKIGAVLVGLNTRWKAVEVADAVTRTVPKLALADGGHLGTVRAAAVVEPMPLTEFRARADTTDGAFERPPLEATDPISFIFTSGTTGHPKAVQQTHGAYVLTGQAYPWWLGLERGARLYACLPLLHVNAQAYSTMGAIGSGGAVVVVERFSATRFWDDIRTYRANAFNFIGAVIAILLKGEPGPHERDNELRVMYGAPAFAEAERAAIEERFGVRVISGFGMSETTFGLIEDPYGERRSASMGKARQHPDPAFVNEARVVDDEGREVPPGEAGELIISNPAIMRGYFNDPEKTAESLRGGWLWTGDLATRDEDGFFYFLDRKKDIVRRRGENVSSVEVEVVLTAHPAVEEAAVVGVPSELTEEEVLALVQLLPGARAEPAELASWCRERLADFKVPRYIQLVPELPKTSTGRLQKGTLRDELADPAAWRDAEAS
jgi:carnitine-CoA ligase